MTAYGTYTSNQSGYCMSSAAACTSARFHKLLDTALGAVSILVIRRVCVLEL